MQTRLLILIPLLLTTIILGFLTFHYYGNTAEAAAYFSHATHSYMGYLWNQTLGFSGQVNEWGLYLWNRLRFSHEFLFYGSLSFFGALMTVVAIGSARKMLAEQSKIEHILQDLTSEKERAESLATLRSEFLNKVSHELRTPLAVIMGYLECLLDDLYGQMHTKHKEILTIVSKQSNELRNMIDHILIFSRLEAQKANLRIEDFRLDKVLNDVRESYGFLIRQKGLEFSWEQPEKLPTMKSDAEKIKEIVGNLLQNAIKYTEHGHIRVVISYQSKQDAVHFSISDTGIGIAKEYLKIIFDPFVQLNKPSSSYKTSGIGLGLSIVRKQVESLKGSIHVESESGDGSTFTVILPRAYRDESQAHKILDFLKYLKRKSNNNDSNSNDAPNEPPVNQLPKDHPQLHVHMDSKTYLRSSPS